MHAPSPLGVQGVGSALAQASDFAAIRDRLTTVRDEILFVQKENQKGLEALDEILTVDGIDGVYSGHSDLAADGGQRECRDMSASFIAAEIEFSLFERNLRRASYSTRDRLLDASLPSDSNLKSGPSPICRIVSLTEERKDSLLGSAFRPLSVTKSPASLIEGLQSVTKQPSVQTQNIAHWPRSVNEKGPRVSACSEWP